MATCTNCYGTNTVQPCDSVGCLSTNYGKCITYSGSNLFCQSGSIATFTFAGTAVAPTTDTSVVASATGGNGTDATFTVIRRAGTTVYEVTLDDIGAGYEVSDVLTIPGTSVGGTSPTNDITITVATLSAVIANGDNLDTVISNLNNRLCLVAASSPSGLDYSAFNYQCLRVGGNLEGVGTAITTAQGFTEAVAAALCSVNTRLKGVELPPIIVDSYFSGTLVSGTSTHTEIFNAYGAAIGDLSGFIDMSSVNGNPCIAYSFTTKPSSSNVVDYINWVTNNVCGVHTTLKSLIDSNTSDIGDITTYITGTSSGTIPTSVDTSCLSGGSATSSLEDATNLVISQLCSLIATVGGTTNYTVNWNCFTAPYIANSVFNAQGLGTFTNTTTLQTHLDQIATALSDLNITFSSDFTVTNGSCGPVVSLVGGSTFTCASLATCNLDAMGDVIYNSPLSSADVLVRNSTGDWTNARLRPTIVGVHSSNTIVPSYNAGSNTLDVNLTFPLSTNQPLIPSPLAGSWLVQFGPAPHITDWTILQRNDTSGLVLPSYYPGVQLVNNSGGNLTINDNASVSLLNIVDSTFLIPTLKPNMYFPVSVVEKTSGGTLSAIHNCLIKVYSIDNATLTSGSYSIIDLVNVKGSAITVANTNILDIYFGGITWSIV